MAIQPKDNKRYWIKFEEYHAEIGLYSKKHNHFTIGSSVITRDPDKCKILSGPVK